MISVEAKTVIEKVLSDAPLITADEALARGGDTLPDQPGLYSWFFRVAPKMVPLEGCRERDGMTLLYIGIAPSGPISASTLRTRIRQHYGSKASSSTLRRTLGCLLADELGIQAGTTSAGRLTFGQAGEAVLSAWMAENARVAVVPCAAPWILEPELIASLTPPLNLEGNATHPFYAQLKRLRAMAANPTSIVSRV